MRNGNTAADPKHVRARCASTDAARPEGSGELIPFCLASRAGRLSHPGRFPAPQRSSRSSAEGYVMHETKRDGVAVLIGIARLVPSPRGIEVRDPVHGHLLGVFEREAPHRLVIKRGNQFVIVEAPTAV